MWTSARASLCARPHRDSSRSSRRVWDCSLARGRRARWWTPIAPRMDTIGTRYGWCRRRERRSSCWCSRSCFDRKAKLPGADCRESIWHDNTSGTSPARSYTMCRHASSTPGNRLPVVCPSWPPRSLCHRRNESSESLRRKAHRLPLFGAHVPRHEHAHDIESIVERESRLFQPEERAHEVAVLRLIAVRHRFVRHHRHLSSLGILLLDEILATL